MRLLKMTVGMGLAVFAMMAMTPARVDAATLVYFHTVGGTVTTYTLVVQEGCTNDCDVSLTIDFSDPSAFSSAFLDSVQFKVDGVTPSDPVLVTAPGGVGAWDISLANLSANECGGGSESSVCTEWDIINNGTVGYDVVAGDSLLFEFTVDFSRAVTTDDSGLVRAGYNRADGKNFAVFSPGSGNFGGDGGGEGGGGIVVPEPASISLFGLGLLGAALRARRRRIG